MNLLPLDRIGATRWTGLAVLILVPFAGCVSAGKYRAARPDTPRAQMLNIAFPPAPLQSTLATLIVCGGPGSWKREALWDEYVVMLRNPGTEPVTLTAAELTDFADNARSCGADPWKLEGQSKALCKEYDRAGVTFIRSATPAVLTIGGFAAGSAATAALLSTSTVTITVLQGPLALVTVPGYIIGRTLANREDKSDIEAEFNIRRLVLPVTLAPGQTRTGCLFFPMVPNPRALRLDWRFAHGQGAAVLDLAFLHGLHAPATDSRPLNLRGVAQ